MDALDLARQDNIFNKPVRLENGEIKTSVGSRKCEANHMVTSILDSVRHLEIDEEAYLPVVIDLRKQILVTFKEAGELYIVMTFPFFFSRKQILITIFSYGEFWGNKENVGVFGKIKKTWRYFSVFPYFS